MLTVLVAVLLLGQVPAAGHVAPVDALLSDGSRVPVMPESFTVVYGGPAEVSGPVWLQSEAGFVLVTHAKPAPEEVVFALPGGEGWFRLRWRVLAEDGHPEVGDVTFLVWPDGEAAPPRPELPLPEFMASTPADGARLTPGADAVAFVFDGVSPGLSLSVTVVSDTAPARPLGVFPLASTVEVPLPELPEGRHRLAWEVVADGGVVVSGGVIVGGSNLPAARPEEGDPPQQAQTPTPVADRAGGSGPSPLLPVVAAATVGLLLLVSRRRRA